LEPLVNEINVLSAQEFLSPDLLHNQYPAAKNTGAGKNAGRMRATLMIILFPSTNTTLYATRFARRPLRYSLRSSHRRWPTLPV
jgi:hypothetical protein